MTMTVVIIFLIAMLLAFANGANDNAKGVATLIGSGTMSARTAVIYAGVTTMLGSICSIFLAGLLLTSFTGKGIVDDTIMASQAFPLAVGLGAGATVLLATFVGMPISTTHAMVGSIIGVGVVGGAVNWAAVWTKFFQPLMISPFIALAGAFALYLLFRYTRQRLGVTSQTCLCVGEETVPLTAHADGSMRVATTGVTVAADELANCRERYDGKVMGIHAQRVLDVSHLFTAGAVSFARGLNDTPKIAALLLAGGALGGMQQQRLALTAVGVGILLGGLLAVRKVMRTMSYRITAMNDGQAFTANLVTAVMVIVASRFGLPVSTTHVSCGSLFGIGAANRHGHWKVIRTILGAWVTTLPVAAVIAALTWLIVSRLI